jgi:hypothetical protein
MPLFKAIELDARSRERTGRQHVLAADTRQAAIDALLELLGKSAEQARIDPTRTLVQLDDQLWTMVAASTPPADDSSSSLRRAGAKHKRVR